MWLIHKPERDVLLTEKNPNIQHCKTSHWNFASPIYCVLLIIHVFPSVVELPRRIWSRCLISGQKGWWTRTLSVISCRWTQSVEPPPGTTLWSEKKPSLFMIIQKLNVTGKSTGVGWICLGLVPTEQRIKYPYVKQRTGRGEGL